MPGPSPAYRRRRTTGAAQIARALSQASATPFWLDSPDKPDPEASLRGNTAADLVVVGGGYGGLWTALQAKEADPDRSVIVAEANEVGWAASGRNGGFCEASLTHGEENGERHFASELPLIRRLAEENFAGLRETVARAGFDTEFEETGLLQVATEEYQVADLRESAAEGNGIDPIFLDEASVRERISSPLVRAGALHTAGYGLVHPAKLAWSLKRACQERGVRFVEHTPVLGLEKSDTGITVRVRNGSISAGRVALATNGFPSLVKRSRLFTIPVYDYVLVTEPLTDAQLADISWTGRYGITDSSRQFHYYRLTADNRILWGGYDAVYHRGGKVRPEYDQRRETFERLADHFFLTFPQLGDLRFTHAWGGMIDMSTRFSAFFGQAYGGRVAYTAGYTGLGVAATRFGARVMLDLLGGSPTERTELAMVRSKPIPIPPEPFAYPAIQLTRVAIARSDENGGKDGLLLKAMDLMGVGFDS